MKKILKLIKVSLSHDMAIFKINTKKQSTKTKIILPLVLTLYIMYAAGYYASMLMDKLKPAHLEFVVLTLFALIVSIITIIEGIYKSGALLFNCRDDNLLLSLPIKKKIVLYVRILKFYVFELLYNSLFILPVMIIYAYNTSPDWTFYLSSFIALLVLPIVPIAISCIIGFIITYLSSKFKGKNIFQTIITTIFLIGILYISINLNEIIKNIASEATSLNDLISRLYYPVGAYITLITDFSIGTLLLYIAINLAIFAVIVFILGKLYFRVNSSQKRVITSHKNTKYKIKTKSRAHAFINKELNKFVSTPVFITNAGFGLVLFILACIICATRFDSLTEMLMKSDPKITIDKINSYIPLIAYGMVCFASFLTSITSSMISLEGKTFSILKSFPMRPLTIIKYKVMTALIIMIPCILIGDIILFINFNFDIITIIAILVASIILPVITEIIGIIINLKYPKIDATNDTEVVKQSMSSLVSTFVGMGLMAAVAIIMISLINLGLSHNVIILILNGFFTISAIVLSIILNKKCDEMFNNITA